MKCYEHTIILKQDLSSSKIQEVIKKYEDIISKNSGKIIKSENWGLMPLSHTIHKNRKGNYFHFKIEGDGKAIIQLEKNERIDTNLLRFLTVKVKEFDLETNYFSEKNEQKNKLKNEKK
jgi:small subunit ribosomal protein S6